MKGSFYRLTAKEVSLITIILMCMTIVIWTWEKTPILSSFVPPETRLQLSTGLLPLMYLYFSDTILVFFQASSVYIVNISNHP